MDFVGGVNYTNDISGSTLDYVSTVAIDPKGCADDTYELSLSDGDGYSIPASAALGVAGGGTVVVSRLPASRTRFAAFAGTLKFTGENPFLLGVVQSASFAGGVGDPEILFDGAKDVDVGGMPLYAGAVMSSSYRYSSGRITVRNSRIYNHLSNSFAEREGFEIGCAGKGVLVCENSAITNRLRIGLNNGRGTMLLKSGQFYAWGGNGGTTHEYAVTKIGDIGHGYLENDGGDFCSKNHVYLGFDSGAGVYVQKSGSFRVSETNSSVQARLYVGGHIGQTKDRAIGQFWQKGGTGYDSFSISIADIGGNSSPTGTVGTFTLDGTGTVFQVQGQMVYLGTGSRSTGILNLNNGGKLMSKMILGAASENGAVSTVNFDGGTFQYTGWGPVSTAGLFGNVSDEGVRTTPIEHVVAGSRGGTIYSSSSQGSVLLGRPIVASTGNGVDSVSWTDTSRTFESCPAVIIDGDGWGASAMADYDADTKTVRGIVVTSRGCDYTQAPVARLYLGVDEVASVVCSLSANVTDGGMTFRVGDSDGSMIFDQANTYRGPTVLIGGSCGFIVRNRNAFACSSALKLKGGILKLGSLTPADLGVPFKFMGGAVSGDAESYVMPEGSVVIDLKDVAAGELYTMANNGNLVLPSSIPLLNGDSAALDEKVKYTLLTLSASYSGTLPTFTGVPKGWHVSRSGRTFRLCHDGGTMLIIR